MLRSNAASFCAVVALVCVLLILQSYFNSGLAELWAGFDRTRARLRSSLSFASRDGLPGRRIVHWINMRHERARAASMQTMVRRAGIAEGAIRIEATTTEDVSRLISSNELHFNKVTPVYSFGNTSNWRAHEGCMFLYAEVACLLSHLHAIHKAYIAGYKEVLILEDDVELEPDFLDQLEITVKSAPLDWEVLQLWTNNQFLAEHGLRLSDPFVSWQPEYWGTLAYLINFAGMQKVLAAASKVDKVWHFREPCLIVADEFVYYAARTYTATRPPGLQRGSFTSAIQQDALLNRSEYDEIVRKVQPRPVRFQLRPEKILVIQSMSMSDAINLAAEEERLRADMLSLATWHANPQWRITIVTPLSFEDTGQPFANLSVKIHILTELDQHSDLCYMKPWLPEFENFDVVLLKDSKQRIAGFPWQTFLQARGRAVISAPLRQATHEYLRRAVEEPKQDWFAIHNAGNWKRKMLTPFKLGIGLNVHFLEAYFALFDAKFLFWFFTTLFAELRRTDPPWWPDRLWCAAASDYDRGRPPCLLIPLTSLDSTSIDSARWVNMSRAQEDHTDKDVSTSITSNRLLGKWLRASQDYRSEFGGNLGTVAFDVAYFKYGNLATNAFTRI